MTVLLPQDIGAVAKAWEDSPYLFIVKMQPLFRGLDEEELGAEQLSFAFTSKKPSNSHHTVSEVIADLLTGSSHSFLSLFFCLLSPVKVEMKGPHDYSSPADWPLMMVCHTSS